MRKLWGLLIGLMVISVVVTGVFAQDFSRNFDGNEMRQRVIRLSSDEFEGRGPGTAGGKRAVAYIAGQLKAAGVKPGNGASYFQSVKMVGIKADPNTRLNVTGRNGQAVFNFGSDFVATSSAQRAKVSAASELVFVGYGIDAPRYRWNDYSGSPQDYKGKILLILVNDPPASGSEPGLFGGKTLTYYGRWTYKYEEAARRGAAGVILIHTDRSAGYGWNVIRSSNGNWRYELARTSSDKTPFLNVKAWISNEAAERMLRLGGLDLATLQAAAAKRGFKPIKTGLKVDLTLNSQLRSFESANVVGRVDGRDARLKSQYVVYTAHWDHLGIGEPDATGDKIFNGAYDNASGVAAQIGIAEALAKLPPGQLPKRSSLFIFTTAEEQGLLGAEYFSKHPVIPLNKIAANVNIDGVNFFGRVKDFSALGAERSSLEAVVEEVAMERGLKLEGDTAPEQGFFFRSDHFPFAKVGVPSISLRHGEDFVTPLAGDARTFFSDYTAKYYHQVSDEYHDWWDVDAMIQNAEIGLAIGVKVGNLTKMPRFNASDEFAAADRKRIR